MVLMTVAQDLDQLGTALRADLVAWGAASIGIALTAAAIMWVMRLLRP